MICIAGKNNIAVLATSYIKSKYPNLEIVAIVNKTDLGKNGFHLSFKKFCELNHIKIVQLEDIYEIEDLMFLSLEFDRIIKPNKFKTKALFNIHFSLLPSFKGMYTSALPIIKNQKYSGVTLHKIDEGIDTGDIIDQISFEIGYETTSQELYELYTKYGFKLLENNLDKLLNNNYQSKPQSSKDSSYYSKSEIDYSNLHIDLNKTAEEIYNQIRAYSFPAYQLPKVKSYSIYHSKIFTEKSGGIPGRIISDDEFTLTLSTIDFDIILYKDRREDMFNAFRTNDLEFIQRLVVHNYPLQQRSKEGWDPLIISAYNGHVNLVKYLIQEHNWDVNTQNNNKTSFAMYVMTHACLSGNFELLKYIKSNYKEIDWTHCDANGKDIFFYAKMYNNKKVLEILS